MWPSWGPSGADRTQVGPVLAPWTLLSRITIIVPGTIGWTVLILIDWCFTFSNIILCTCVRLQDIIPPLCALIFWAMAWPSLDNDDIIRISLKTSSNVMGRLTISFNILVPYRKHTHFLICCQCFHTQLVSQMCKLVMQPSHWTLWFYP